MKYILANWKENKDFSQVKTWISEFKKNNFETINKEIELILMPPFPFLIYLKEELKEFSFIKIGSQDISFFEDGAYTGEVGAPNLTEITNYSLIGHSERRKYFSETNDILFQKSNLAQKYKITPIFCIRGLNDPLPSKIEFIAYEPTWAIGTNQNEPLENIIDIKNKLNIKDYQKFIYGGSVNENNFIQYINHPEINGILIGGASLIPENISKILLSL